MNQLRIPLPWTNVYGLARTLVALGTAGTLAVSSAETLFRPVATIGDYPLCTSTTAASVFCLAPHDYAHLTWIKWACVLVLLIVASGWRPRLTAIPHAYINYSIFSGIAIADGGDQIALILSVLFILPAIGDRRRWHWEPQQQASGTRAASVLALIGASGLFMVRAQMVVLYFQAAVAKLPHAEWQDGTAMWYWGSNLDFGPASWINTLIRPIITTPLGVGLMTWVPLVIELSLAICLLLPQRLRWWVMNAGLFFHLSIALVMGLWSFALAMAAGILVLCQPLGGSIHIRNVMHLSHRVSATEHEVEGGPPNEQDGSSVPPASVAQPTR
ncbi:HTTM domain-containing protein [Streptomyces sp. AV19]|uniref:sporulation-delaying protein SdpB family protein n=1 Tax=Streptomyces sp. AV19 TaxID=2793068 RepID=UPI0018FE5EA9|nr:sporulation-delaying protein SdpB family protein [Streptomyces sp. AV19]MBH1938633.1 HTTM domain-containing protein [Streptomyces sp. AV19]MDG4535345.1 HTTM domain-containing protein [Streptomyces sp. AV19]